LKCKVLVSFAFCQICCLMFGSLCQDCSLIFGRLLSNLFSDLWNLYSDLWKPFVKFVIWSFKARFKTCLTQPLFIEVCVTSNECERSFICGIVISSELIYDLGRFVLTVFFVRVVLKLRKIVSHCFCQSCFSNLRSSCLTAFCRSCSLTSEDSVSLLFCSCSLSFRS
jgi:hypothetical protein